MVDAMDISNSIGLFGHPMDSPGCGGYPPSNFKALRSRLDSTASTVAPDSSAMSVAATPEMSPETETHIDPAEPFLMADFINFMLPAAEHSSREELMNEPVSRVSSPAHKVPRLIDVPEKSGAEAGCTTPRAATVTDSPRTPPSLTRTVRGEFTPPPLIPNSKATRPKLLQALQNQSVDEVRAALLIEDAHELFWEHDCEPPLCCAVRIECSPSIVKLLLDNGADPTATDKRGRTPLKIVQQKQASQQAQEIYQAVWTPMMAPFHPTMPHEFAGMPLGGLLPYANSTGAWCQQVSDLLEGQSN